MTITETIQQAPVLTDLQLVLLLLVLPIIVVMVHAVYRHKRPKGRELRFTINHEADERRLSFRSVLTEPCTGHSPTGLTCYELGGPWACERCETLRDIEAGR